MFARRQIRRHEQGVASSGTLVRRRGVGSGVSRSARGLVRCTRRWRARAVRLGRDCKRRGRGPGRGEWGGNESDYESDAGERRSACGGLRSGSLWGVLVFSIFWDGKD